MARSITAGRAGLEAPPIYQERDEPISDLGAGWLPAVSAISALGLLSLALIDRLSASGVQGLDGFFWLGLGVITAPIVVRLLAARASRGERLGLALLFGLDLYLVKVLQSPFTFTYSDEFLHQFNVNQVLSSAHLFGANSLLAASPLYPGLEAATAAIVRLSGLSVFSAGLVLIGVARVVMTLALFLLYEQLTGSHRAASLGSVLYAANANFLFWSAQFSYESLALPLAVLVLFVVVRREDGRHQVERLSLTVAALILISAVVVTHHLSSYYLVGALAAWAGLAALQRRRAFEWPAQRLSGWAARLPRQPLRGASQLAGRLMGRPAWAAPEAGAANGGPGGLALFGGMAVLFWLTYVATLTLSYLSPVFGKAIVAILQTISGEASARALFQSATGAVGQPLWERATAIGAVLLSLLGLPFGLREVWRRSRHPLVLFLAGTAVAYFGVIGLRFIPSAWEIANRSSEFLFFGLALVLAMARLPSWAALRGLMRRVLRPLLAASLLVMLAGGVIAGWPPQLRLTQVYQVNVDGQVLVPPGLSLARWTLAWLGPGHTFVSDEANARYLQLYANQNVIAGNDHDVRFIFEDPGLSGNDLGKLEGLQAEYALVDKRIISADNMAGFFFDRSTATPPPADAFWPPEAYTKFDNLPGVSRLLDNGDAAIYDVRSLVNASAQP